MVLFLDRKHNDGYVRKQLYLQLGNVGVIYYGVCAQDHIDGRVLNQLPGH